MEIKTIYSITNIINGRVYVGCTSDLSKRKYSHKMHAINGTYKEGNLLYPDINKFGFSNFKFEVMEECSEKISKEREKVWINRLNSHGNGYNTSYHGLCGPGHWTNKKRPDQSLAKKGRIHLIQKAIDATKKKTLCIDTGMVFVSATEAAIWAERTYSAIAYAVRNKTKCAGLRWEYLK